MQTGISKYLNWPLNAKNTGCTGPLSGADISLSNAKWSSVPANISSPQNLYQIWQQMVARTGWHFAFYCQEMLSCKSESSSHFEKLLFVAEDGGLADMFAPQDQIWLDEALRHKPRRE